jgi:hypothetical protein
MNRLSFRPCSGRFGNSLHERLEVFDNVDRSPERNWFRRALRFVAILAPLAERAAVTCLALAAINNLFQKLSGRCFGSRNLGTQKIDKVPEMNVCISFGRGPLVSS